MRKALLFALAGSATAAFIWWRAPSPPRPSGGAKPAPVSAAPSGAAAPSGPVLRFESSPPGAVVTGPAGVLGSTPFDHALAGGIPPKSVVFSLKGYFTRQLNVAAEERLVRVKLLKK